MKILRFLIRDRFSSDSNVSEGRFVFLENHSEDMSGENVGTPQSPKENLDRVKKSAVGERSELEDEMGLLDESDAPVGEAALSSFAKDVQARAIENAELAGTAGKLVDSSLAGVEANLESEDTGLEFHNGFALYQDKKTGLFDFVSDSGEVLGPFDEAGPFNSGLARVKIGNVFDFINIKGERLLNDENVVDAMDFKDGFASVNIANKYNFVDVEGNLLLKDGVDYALPFEGGFALVASDGSYNFVDARGDSLLDEGVNFAQPFKDGLAEVQKDGETYFVNTRGRRV